MMPADLERPPWPATLVDGLVVLRPVRRRDAPKWAELRERNSSWLGPWDATSPEGATEQQASFWVYAADQLRRARRGNQLPWMIEYDGELVGQLSVNSIIRGAAHNGSVGYWISRHVAGRGIVPTSVALAFDHATQVVGLHRLEIAIRPENRNSLRVVEKLGFRDEGFRPAYLHVAGEWRDHRIFALNADDVPGGLLARWHAQRPPERE
jgi:ribosomal-protein-alanine N-acetyltransferase